MAGYKLINTLSENGSVSRGICSVKDGYLTQIEEKTDITPQSGIDGDTIVSMNMWGLDKDFFPYLEEKFREFLDKNINQPKKEFFLPDVIGQRIKEQNMSVKVIKTREKWYGITYAQDLNAVREAIKSLTEKGIYRG